MAWIVLILSGMFEAVWVTAMDRIGSWRDVGPLTVYVLGSIVSLGGLWWALRELPVGTAYAVWVGIGAATTVLYAVATGSETMSLVKGLLLLGLVSCVAGLKLVEG